MKTSNGYALQMATRKKMPIYWNILHTWSQNNYRNSWSFSLVSVPTSVYLGYTWGMVQSRHLGALYGHLASLWSARLWLDFLLVKISIPPVFVFSFSEIQYSHFWYLLTSFLVFVSIYFMWCSFECINFLHIFQQVLQTIPFLRYSHRVAISLYSLVSIFAPLFAIFNGLSACLVLCSLLIS